MKKTCFVLLEGHTRAGVPLHAKQCPGGFQRGQCPRPELYLASGTNLLLGSIPLAGPCLAWLEFGCRLIDDTCPVCLGTLGLWNWLASWSSLESLASSSTVDGAREGGLCWAQVSLSDITVLFSQTERA